MLHPDPTKRSPQPQTFPLGLFASFSPLNLSSEQQKTLRIAKQTMSPLPDNQTITESRTFINAPMADHSQQQLITSKNISIKSRLNEENSLKIDKASNSSIKKQQVCGDHTKLKEGQPQLLQFLSSLKQNESQVNQQFPYKRQKRDSTVQIVFCDEDGGIEESEEIADGFNAIQRKKRFSLNQTVSIVFIPNDYHRKVPFLSDKNGKKCNEEDDYSIISHKSNFTQKSQFEQVQIPFPKSNLIHLNEIGLLMHKDQQKHERANELRHANEKMLHLFLLNKEQLDEIKKQMEKMKECYIVLQRELEKEKEGRLSIIAEKEQKQETIRLLKELNERYLKDNNDTKEKLKTYLRNIHELKLQLAQKQHKQRQNYLRGSQSTQNLNLQSKTPQNGQNNQIIHPMTTKNGRSYLDTSQNIQVNLKGFKKSVVQEKVKKINNSYSIPHFQNIKNQKKDQQEGENQYSYRNVTLTPNFFTQMTEQDDYEPKFGSGASTININPPRRHTLKLGKQKQADRSLSGFSNLSGISASQKVGYLVKQRKDNNIGELIDYLETEDVDYERTFRARDRSMWNINKNQ